MKIKIEHGDYEENEILLRCREVDSEIMRIIAFLNLQTQKLSGWKSKEEITMLEFKDVYYWKIKHFYIPQRMSIRQR